jgi:hypothetical protein
MFIMLCLFCHFSYLACGDHTEFAPHVIAKLEKAAFDRARGAAVARGDLGDGEAVAIEELGSFFLA